MLKRHRPLVIAATWLVAVQPSISAEAGALRHGHEARGFALVPPAYYPPAYYRTFYAPPVDLYGYGRVFKPVSSSVNCGWLKRHAINTHSPSSWVRYHRCRGF